MSVRVVTAVAVCAVALSSSCSHVDRGVDGPASFGVSGADRVEVRQVVDPSDPDEPGGSSQRLPTPFGEYTYRVGTVPAAAVETLTGAVGAARYIDTGGVTYDLANPEYEVVFFRGTHVLAHLGYYTEISTWGEFEEPGRWIDCDWRLLALTTELPRRLNPEPTDR